MLGRLEERMGLPKGYVQTLRDKGSDWEFVIKLAMLAEGATTKALVSSLHQELLFDHISGSPQSTRLKLCLKLGLLDKGEVAILEILSTTRNQFAHRIENLERSLADYVEQMPNGQKASTVNRFVPFEAKDRLSDKSNFLWLPTRFRTLLFDVVALPLHSLAMKDLEGERERERRAFREQLPAAAIGAFFANTEPTLLTATPNELAKLLKRDPPPTDAGSSP